MLYFQYSKTAANRQIYALTLFHIFVMVLDVFSEFLATELEAPPGVEPGMEVLQTGSGRPSC